MLVAMDSRDGNMPDSIDIGTARNNRKAAYSVRTIKIKGDIL